MVRQVVKTKEVEGLRGGKGKIILHDILTPDELLGHCKMYGKAILPPGCSIGHHQHTEDFETYYILEGEGVFTDADGSKKIVKAGDCANIYVGQSHALANESDKDLVFIYIVVNDRAK